MLSLIRPIHLSIYDVTTLIVTRFLSLVDSVGFYCRRYPCFTYVLVFLPFAPIIDSLIDNSAASSEALLACSEAFPTGSKALQAGSEALSADSEALPASSEALPAGSKAHPA